ncbi:hypothetical protein B0H11DRAFT_2209853 [Mycena galericulata]|nr:hypothetical protein B0H11DRAFT_2209853 [Mycena galericulata]
MLRYLLLSHIILMLFASNCGASHIFRRNVTEVPTTTDFPPPETTQQNSTIYIAWSDYVQECGPSGMQAAQEGAIDQYKTQFGSPPPDPNSLDFVNWAITNFFPYNIALATCQNLESSYQQMLATFVPQISPSTSAKNTEATGNGNPSSVSASSAPAVSGTSGNRGGSSNGFASSRPPRIMFALAWLGFVLGIHRRF